MEITNALLVAMMFVVLLTIGIGNIIMALAVLVDRRTPVKPDAIHTSWVALLLLVYFNLFWHVLDILTVADWKFLEFLYIVAGALLLFFATHVLLPDASSPDTNDLRAYYFGISRQFFIFLALLQLWILGVDLMLRKGLTAASSFNAAALALAILLAASQRPKVHSLGTGTAWILFVAGMVAQGLGLIS